MFRNHEVFQAHCRVCAQPCEGLTAQEAIRAAEAHEARMERLVLEGKAHPRTHKPIKPKPEVVSNVG